MAAVTATLEGSGTFKLEAKEARKLNNIAENRLQQALTKLADKRKARIQHLGRNIVKMKFEVGVLSAEKEIMAISKFRKRSELNGSGNDDEVHSKQAAIKEDSVFEIKRTSHANKDSVAADKVKTQKTKPTTEEQLTKHDSKSTFNKPYWSGQTQAYQTPSRSTSSSSNGSETSKKKLPKIVNTYQHRNYMLNLLQQATRQRRNSARTLPFIMQRQADLVAANQNGGSKSRADDNKTLGHYYSCISRGHFSHKKLQLQPPKFEAPSNDVRLVLHTLPPITRRRISSRLPPILPPSQQRLQGTGKFRRAAVRAVNMAGNIKA